MAHRVDAVIDLSIVLISRNQEWNIARLIESVLNRTSIVDTREVVLVDSDSSDRTVEIASRYPIGILKLNPELRLSSHAGRYIGYKSSSGKLILFLDGDMELYEGWLEQALPVMESKSDVAVIAGPWIDVPINADQTEKPQVVKNEFSHRTDTAIEAKYVGGAALYRRSVLEEVGPFNPHLYSDGEPELCIRIRHAGYRVLRLSHPIAYHYSPASDAISTLVGRWRRNMWLGVGQNLRYHLGTELFLPYLRERGYGCIPAFALVVLLAVILWSVVMQSWTLLSLSILVMALLLVGDAIRKRSLYRVVFSLIHRLFVVDGTLRGFILQPQDPQEYSGLVDLIRRPQTLRR